MMLDTRAVKPRCAPTIYAKHAGRKRRGISVVSHDFISTDERARADSALGFVAYPSRQLTLTVGNGRCAWLAVSHRRVEEANATCRGTFMGH
jgi:hypothetical protein